MEFFLVLVGFLLDQGATALRERLRSDDHSWASEVRDRLQQLVSLRLTPPEGDAIERWLGRGDVVAALMQTGKESNVEIADRISAALAYELGSPAEEGLGDRATELAVATVVNLIDVVDPATSATLSVHKTVRDESANLKAGQAEMYAVLL